jgi:hypothetical protein
MHFRLVAIFLCGFLWSCSTKLTAHEDAFYIVTAADGRFFSVLLNFIGGVHRVNFDDLGEIAVFDLGLKDEQRTVLAGIDKVRVYQVEMTNPYLLTHFVIRPGGRTAPGWYSWKPVVIKQALDMFPDILYIDAGLLVLKPLNHVFRYLRKNGYFLIDCAHNIKIMTTKYVIEKFNLNSKERSWIMEPHVYGISAGFQGLTHSLYNNYVLPMYENSKDIELFVDDGTSSGGFGWGRCDQTLFSIYARLLKLHIFPWTKINCIDDDDPSVTFGYGKDFIRGTNLKTVPDFKPFIRYRCQSQV